MRWEEKERLGYFFSSFSSSQGQGSLAVFPWSKVPSPSLSSGLGKAEHHTVVKCCQPLCHTIPEGSLGGILGQAEARWCCLSRSDYAHLFPIPGARASPW